MAAKAKPFKLISKAIEEKLIDDVVKAVMESLQGIEDTIGLYVMAMCEEVKAFEILQLLKAANYPETVAVVIPLQGGFL